jgi:zinc protease
MTTIARHGDPADTKGFSILETAQQELMNMKLDDFRSMIYQYFQEKELVYLVVGDKATQWEEVKKLGKAEVVELDIYGNMK